MSIRRLAVSATAGAILAYGAIVGSAPSHAAAITPTVSVRVDPHTADPIFDPVRCHSFWHCHLKRLEHGRI